MEKIKKDKNDKTENEDIKKREKNEEEEISKLMKRSKKSQKYSKFNIGYDVIRQNTFFTVEMMTDAKGTHIDYDKLVIKRDKKPSDEAKESGTSKKSDFKNSEKAPVLQHAVVEYIKVEEDVL